MAGRRTKLTPEVHEQIVSLIRQGAYDWVAAQAAGIGPRTFYRWMASGEAGNAKYRQFWQDVLQARAQARLSAEIEVKKEDLFRWLRYGPGRERPGRPGWTQQVEHVGKEGGAIEHEVEINVPNVIKDEQARKHIAGLLERIAASQVESGHAGSGSESEPLDPGETFDPAE